MQSSFLTKILPRTKEEVDYFWALEVYKDKIKAALCVIKEGEVKILGVGEKDYDVSWEKAILTSDEVISQIEERLTAEASNEQSFSSNKVILGLPTEYTEDGKIKEPYLTNLKNLCQRLSLTPLGFVEIPLAIIHLLQKQEGGPQSLILARIGQELTVTLVRVGKISNNITVTRTDNLAFDLEKAITSFAPVEILPSRILLYDGKAGLDGEKLEKAAQELINHPWLSRAPFLHFPKIEVAPKDQDIKAVAFAGAGEVAQVLEVTETVKTEQPKEALDFGFVKDSDILEEASLPKKEIREEPSIPENFTLKQEVIPPSPWGRFLPKITFPQGEKLKALLRARFAWIILLAASLLLLLGGGTIAALWYIPIAQVNLILESQTFEQTLKVGLNPKLTAAQEGSEEIPGLLLEIEEKGAKKTNTTGKKIVGEPARGEVTIYNKITNNKTFKKGTIFISPNNLKFSLEEEIIVASASESIGSLIFGKQNVHLTAVDIGPEGNLGVGQEFNIADFPTTSYSARNEVAFSGGTSREISVVARSDQERLLASASSELLEQAKRDLEGKLSPGEKILGETLVGKITQKKFGKEVDEEATELGLEISMYFNILGFREDELLRILEKKIATSIPTGFEFKPELVKMEIANIEKKEDSSLLLKINFTVPLLPKMNEEEIKKNLVGKSLTDADHYLRYLGNIAGYEIKFGRTFPFGKRTLPRLAKNIKIEIGDQK